MLLHYIQIYSVNSYISKYNVALVNYFIYNFYLLNLLSTRIFYLFITFICLYILPTYILSLLISSILYFFVQSAQSVKYRLWKPKSKGNAKCYSTSYLKGLQALQTGCSKVIHYKIIRSVIYRCSWHQWKYSRYKIYRNWMLSNSRKCTG